MTNIDQQIEDRAAEYRNDFSYLTDHRFELLCMAAAQNADLDNPTDDEFLALFSASLEGFTSYSREEIEEIC